MSDTNLVATIGRVIERLFTVVSQDEELKTRLRSLAKQVLDATEPAASTPPTPLAVAPEIKPPAPPKEPPVSVDVTKLFRGGPTAYVPTPPPVHNVTDADLPLIESHCRMKAEGARWSGRRRRLIADGADYKIEIQPMDREVIEKAKKIPNCFLWMNHPNFQPPLELDLLDELAGCYDAMAEAIALVRHLLDAQDKAWGDFEESLNLLAESQSALRTAVETVEYKQDEDQFSAYLWLKGACKEFRVYIPQYMRVEDSADPSAWAYLCGRIEALEERIRAGQQRDKQYQSALKKARHHLKAVTSGDGEDHAYDWRVVIETVDKLVADGVPPSNTDLRELLLPFVENVPDVELPPGFSRVLREIDRFLSLQPQADEAEDTSEPTAEIQAVADLLRDKTLILIGGVRRPKAHEALKRAFALKEVDWIETREHESIAPFESHIARPDAAVVVLAIRWSSHSYGEVKQFCELHGKPLVRLPAGYNPNQVAMQIMQQCGQRLASAVTV